MSSSCNIVQEGDMKYANAEHFITAKCFITQCWARAASIHFSIRLTLIMCRLIFIPILSISGEYLNRAIIYAYKINIFIFINLVEKSLTTFLHVFSWQELKMIY